MTHNFTAWHVKSASGDMHEIKGKDNILWYMLLGEIRHIINVLYVPSFMKNLLSIGFIANQRYLVVFSQRKCWIIQANNPHEIVGISVRDKNNCLYHLQTIILKEINNIKNLGDVHLWHKQMAHLSYKSIYFMSKQ